MSIRRSILLADDEPGMRDLFRFVLEPLGFEVVTAKDGLDAVECFTQRSFDLVVLDMHMPRLNGAEALRRIRALSAGQRILIVSSRADPERDTGPDIDCLFKPIGLDELLAAIERALAKEPS
jgi:CheY-like chemotaxis protein